VLDGDLDGFMTAYLSNIGSDGSMNERSLSR
jgi:hypothetical protein